MNITYNDLLNAAGPTLEGEVAKRWHDRSAIFPSEIFDSSLENDDKIRIAGRLVRDKASMWTWLCDMAEQCYQRYGKGIDMVSHAMLGRARETIAKMDQDGHEDRLKENDTSLLNGEVYAQALLTTPLSYLAVSEAFPTSSADLGDRAANLVSLYVEAAVRFYQDTPAHLSRQRAFAQCSTSLLDLL